MNLKNVRRGLCPAVIIVALCPLAACASSPKKGDAAAKLAVEDQVNDRLAAADKAQKAGETDKAVEQLDAAIKIDPSSKAPWLKKAQIHFDARQYGVAITEAQEVLQRDVTDLTAKSILAVSGLRVSADALDQLRKVNEVTGSTRNEAENVAKLIRSALGEPILVPPPGAGNSEPLKAKLSNNRTGVVRPVAGPASVPRVAIVPATPAVVMASTKPAPTGNAAPSSNGRNNPFGALK